jgi:hypothetical protein
MDIAMSARVSGEAQGRSEASGVLDGGPAPRGVFRTDGLRRTDDSR